MSGRWASRPWQWVVVAVGIAAVIVAVAWPGLAPYTVGAAAGLLVATGIRHLIRGRKTRTASEEQQAMAVEQCCTQQPAREQLRKAIDGDLCLCGNDGCPTPDRLIDAFAAEVRANCRQPDDDLTAQEARDLADDLSLQLYRAQDALEFVAEMCDIADEHRGKRGEPATVTTTRVREWLRGAQCARQTGLVFPILASCQTCRVSTTHVDSRGRFVCLACDACPCGETPCVRTGINDPAVSGEAANRPDASGRAPETTRTHPDAPGEQDADQRGDDPDALRNRLADILGLDPNTPWTALLDRAADIDRIAQQLAPAQAEAAALREQLAGTPTTPCRAQYHGFPGETWHCQLQAHDTATDHLNAAYPGILQWPEAAATYPSDDVPTPELRKHHTPRSAR